MRLYQMRDKIIYGTVRQYHIWFIPKKTVFQKVLDKSTMDGYTNMRNLRAARWCSGLTCRPVTAEIVSSNLIRVASAEVAQW